MLVGCVPHLADEEKSEGRLREVLEAILRGLRIEADQTAPEHDKHWQGMICIESHGDGQSLHYHWAVQFPKLSISTIRFERIQSEVLMPIFGKHTWVAAGTGWWQVMQYYVKNVAPKGKADALFLSIPEMGQSEIIQAKQAISEKQLNPFRLKNRHAIQMYMEGKAYEMYDEGLYPLQMIPQVDRGIKTMLRLRPVEGEIARRIENTECIWMHGPSRTGKTWSAINVFTWEKPGDPTSRKLDYLKVSVAGTQAGFFNGYLG